MTIMFVLASCTMEKQVHRPGYHTDCMTSKHNGHKGKYKNCSLCTPMLKENTEQFHQTTIAAVEQSVVEPNLIDDINTSAENGKNIASVDNKQIILPQKTKDNWLAKSSETIDELKELKPTFMSKKGTKMISSTGENPKVEGLGLAGFIIGWVGLFMPLALGLIMCILAIIFGAISLGRIKRNPEKYKGKGFALTSLIVGIVGVGIVLLLAALLV